ncbi:MAG: RNase P modulator RnpM [Dethiobacteria bacterium]
MVKKRIPMRLCVGCQQEKPKKELVRIVLSPEGEISVDPTGKKAGRGAYVCPNKQCLQTALKGKRIEKSLKHAVPLQIKELLEKELVNDGTS